MKSRTLSSPHYLLILCCLLGLTGVKQSSAEHAVVAVAANFSATATQLATDFEHQFPHTITLRPGATGKHYAQIIHGAKIDLFLAADSAHPHALTQQSIGLIESRKTYALGQISLFMRGDALEVPSYNPLTAIRSLAIANPNLAPYGRAAHVFLQSTANPSSHQYKLILGENVNQALQFALTGAADAAIVAHSQVLHLQNSPENTARFSHRRISTTQHPAIEQQLLLLSTNSAAQAFAKYLLSTKGQATIVQAGYLPATHHGKVPR